MWKRFSAAALYLAVAAASEAAVVNLEVVSTTPATSSPIISRDFQAFSIEFAFFVDFNGNKSHPNHFTNNLLANLRAFNGDVPQIIRVGGNTQDHVTYHANQSEGIINYWDPAYNSDQPRNSSIGPSFWESFNAVQGTKYIPGLNFYKNDSDFLENLKSQVEQSLAQIPESRLHLFEIGNENDYGALSGFRPSNWTQQDWVDEWIYRARNVQTPGNTLRFYAPSSCCYNITTKYSFFSPWTIWNSTFGYDRDGWIREVSQHGYISGTGLNPTLQGTLMNHTSVVKNGTVHKSLFNLNHKAGRIYTLGETNSVSGQGARGVSNVFGSALFIVDYELYYASFGVHRMHMHQGTGYRYGAWLPISQNGTGPTTNPPYYGHVMVSKFIGNSSHTRINNIDLGSDFYAAYAAYEGDSLARVVLLNLNEWNLPNTESDNSEPGADKQTERPKTKFVLDSIEGYKYATVDLMTAPGALSTTNITVAGVSYDYHLGHGKPVFVGPRITKAIYPDRFGRFSVNVEASQALLLTFY